MGKLSDALDRHQSERAVKTLMFRPETDHGLGTVMQKEFDPKLVVLTAPESMDAENFKVLKGQIFFPKDGIRPRTILVTSAFPGEGKSFIAANLAASIAQGMNEYALLVDCDFRRPRIHKILGYSNKEGLSDYLTGKKPLHELLIKTKIEKLSLLTSGTSPSKPSELLSSNMMKELFQEFKERYDDRYVIVDTAPSHVISEVNILAKYVDGVIFVVMAGKSPREVIQKSIEAIGKEKVLGIIFNGYEKAYKPYDRYYRNYYKKD
ncbi:putative Non-specific protein-tyrosine kinase [uncultured Desulfobacterium sp.]|uniref:non-specific protein-tyrosine kinase n=1 Tax=uncultured Desulfobacterium sp. TaxID=201089 RepID=A0A445MZQ4_9BACT|nr:putative Non-specific protein-tyrosine kinase [uncultured Desulfobacterium sp.]